jgi:ribosomal protein S18 acetylase RimI-like enzyme
MKLSVHIREFNLSSDYQAVLDLWSGMEQGVKVGRSDSLDEIQKKLERDPDLFLVAEAGGRVIGTVMGAFDGRRGMIYHLAVRSEVRRQGIASSLMNEVERRLIARGCVKCYLLVFSDNHDAVKFYERLGWKELTENRILGKEFPS